MLMKLLQPLCIVNVGLAARDIPDVACIYQQHLETVGLQDFKNRYPVHACRFHGDGGDTHFRKPLRQTVQIGAEGSESTHWPSVALSRYRNHVSSGSDIDASR
jgi:hypothetical protein